MALLLEAVAPNVHPLARLSKALMRREPRFDTRYLHEAQSHLHAQHESIRLSVREPGSFRAYRELRLASLGTVGLTLGCIESSAGYELAFQSGDEMLVNIPLLGHGWVEHGGVERAFGSGQLLLVGPCSAIVKRWTGPGQVLSLHIPLATLAATRLRPGGHDLPLYLPPVALLDHSQLPTLLGLLELLLQDESRAVPFGAAALAHAEQLLLALLIEGLALIEPSVAAEACGAVPYYVRRAEAHIRSHAGEELCIDQLAAIAGVSRRSLQYGFRKAHGVAPMLYAKRVRFELARSALREAAAQGRKVSEIAADIGCFNVSQFSRDYRAMFGESPSETAALPQHLCGH